MGWVDDSKYNLYIHIYGTRYEMRRQKRTKKKNKRSPIKIKRDKVGKCKG